MKRTFLFLLAALTLIAVHPRIADAQCTNLQPGQVKDEVDRIIAEALDRMELNVGGVKAATWVPPDSAATKRIKCLGQAAIPAITAHLSSGRSFEPLLGVRMLGLIGGSKVVPPLVEVLNKSRSETVQIYAIESLYSGPANIVIPVLAHESNSNPFPRVRAKAAEAMGRYGSDQIKAALQSSQ